MWFESTQSEVSYKMLKHTLYYSDFDWQHYCTAGQCTSSTACLSQHNVCSVWGGGVWLLDLQAQQISAIVFACRVSALKTAHSATALVF